MNTPKPFSTKGGFHAEKDLPVCEAFGVERKDCFNLEELMQFEAARQRALAQLSPEVLYKPIAEFVPNRVFINHIDTFNGKHLVKYLTQQLREPNNVGEESEVTQNENESMTEDENTNNFEEYNIEESSEEDENKSGSYVPHFEILGTLDFVNNPKYLRPEKILEILDQEKRTEFLEKVLTCGYIIYDITSDLSCHPKQIEEAKWVAESIVKRLEEMERLRPKVFAKYKERRTFILISTLLTWAKTKPIDPGDPTLPFTERDFRKRKPHPNYRLHCDLEKRIIELGRKYPNHFRTIVVGSGVPYGHEEDNFHFFFKLAWQNAPNLPIFETGNNVIPVIHIDSLSHIIYSIIESFPQKYKYIVATDPHSIILKKLVKLIAKQLGNGKTINVNKHDAFSYPDLKQRNYDMLTADVNIIPGYVMDNMMLTWGTDRPFYENIPKLIMEYKTARGLLPIKIYIHGPPASGKTFLAKRLATYYDIPHLHVKGVIEDTIQTLKNKIEALEEKKAKMEESEKESEEKVEIEGDEAEEEENEEVSEEEENLEALKQTLKEIEENMDNEKHRLDDEFVIRFFKEKLLSNICKNKGYVLDGFPKTMEQTKALFQPGPGEEELGGEDDEVQGDVSHLYNSKIIPEFIESLDASDEFLINRAIKLPVIAQTPFEEQEMCRRLTQFRAINTEDNTPLIYYDELEIYPMIYNLEQDLHPQMDPTFNAIIQHIGPPRNYQKEEEEFDKVLGAHKENASQKQHMELKALKEEIKKAAQERRDNLEKWLLMKNQDMEMEEKALLIMGMPLRHYLMRYIFPTLTRGLVEVARVRPDDPVDFLAEFLFRENPEGKMFQPNYDEREEKLAQAIKEYEESLIKPASLERKSSKRSSRKSSTQRSSRSDAVSKMAEIKCSLLSTESSKSKSSVSRMSSIKSFKAEKSHKLEKSSVESVTSEICTCRKTESLSTCSSDVTPSSATSCHCHIAEPCEPCDPCSSEEDDEDEGAQPCKCPCVS